MAEPEILDLRILPDRLGVCDMIIAHITDLHLGFHGPNQKCENSERLRKVIKELNSLKAAPDLVLITGDLVEGGENWAYKKLKKELQSLNAPYFFALGNHDNRSEFSNIFPEASFSGGFLQYAIESWPLRIIVLDSLENGRHGGGFCEKRALWLTQTLEKDPTRPTLLAIHHPPIDTGIAWMTASKNDSWVQNLERVVSKYDNIVQIICGHIHRSIFKSFAGTQISVSQSVAPQVHLELSEIHHDRPDNRVLISDSGPAYSLLQWKAGDLTTHHASVPIGPPLVKFDKKHAFIIRETLDLPPKK